MDEMIERVAYAIRDTNANTVGLTFNGLTKAMARAAIEAMREPTKSMIVAGESVLVGTDAPNYVSGSIFNAMIDAALATPPAEG